jgi:hypothetical protein
VVIREIVEVVVLVVVDTMEVEAVLVTILDQLAEEVLDI